jgi:hypothetical protein
VHQVRGDAEQPGTDVDVLGAVGGPAPEGDQERLAQQVVGQVPDAPAEIAVHRRRVPVEQGGEVLGLLERPGDELGVGRQRVGHRPERRGSVPRRRSVGHGDQDAAHGK